MKPKKQQPKSEAEKDAEFDDWWSRTRRAQFAGLAGDENSADLAGSSETAKQAETITYSVAEAARILKVSQVTIYRLIQVGKLRTLKSVRHKRIPKVELERFVKEDVK